MSGISPISPLRILSINARIGRERLFHENVDALLDGVLDVQRSNIGARRAHGNVAGPEDVDGPFIGVETDKLPVCADVHLVRVPFSEGFKAQFHFLFMEIGHRIQLDGAGVWNTQSIADGAGAATTASDQRQANRVVLPGEGDR